MSSSSFVTPLRYPGGKGRLGFWLGELIKYNSLEDGCYVEPYAGGAGAAVYLLLNRMVDRIIINDADPVIYAFWWALLNETDKLIDLVNTTEVTIDEWYLQQEIVAIQDVGDLTRLGFATFFLNRTNRSGIIKGGVIGGKKQDGKYKLDARYNKKDLVSRMEKLGKLRGKVKLFNVDAVDLLNDEVVEPKALVYLDPPYYNKGSQLYRNHYRPEDHVVIASKVKSLSCPFLVTYDNCEEIRSLYTGVESVEFDLRYSTHLSRPIASEVMFHGNITLQSEPYLKR